MQKKFKLEPTFKDELPAKKSKEPSRDCAQSVRVLPKDSYKITSRLNLVRGKKISMFYPLYIDNAPDLLKTLKSTLGYGGHVEYEQDYAILHLQGDKIAQTREILVSMGFMV